MDDQQWVFLSRQSGASRSETIRHGDAIVDGVHEKQPQRVRWPKADFIVGNPPFLGGKKLRSVLGDEYVDALFKAWYGDVPKEADLVAYWHESAREMIENKRAGRVGLIATQGIRGGANQAVLKRITETGSIFNARSDIPWVVDGADVRISVVCQDNGSETLRFLDGNRVEVIRSDLSGGAVGGTDVTLARPLPENAKVAFMGDTKGGAFDIDEATATDLLGAPRNVNKRSNDDVVLPWINGLDVTRRPRFKYIIDFSVNLPLRAAEEYELPFEHVRKAVRPLRMKNNRAAYRERWWSHVEPRPAMRSALRPLDRFIVTPTVSKHRVFAWIHRPVVPDHQLIVIARDDWYTFGVLQSSIHEAWSLKMCTWLGVGNDPRYIPTRTFDTFPFPWPLSAATASLTSEQHARAADVARAAQDLDESRNRWLNPPELVEEQAGLTSVHPKRLVPRSPEAAAALNKRTLTALYNLRPAWLDSAHKRLDKAVIGAYGWPSDISEDQIVDRLLGANMERSGETAKDSGGERQKRKSA